MSFAGISSESNLSRIQSDLTMGWNNFLDGIRFNPRYSFKSFDSAILESFLFGWILPAQNCGNYLGLWRFTMESAVRKRRGISILVVLGAILVMIASWNPGDNDVI